MKAPETVTADLTSFVPDNWYDVQPVFAEMTNAGVSAQHLILTFVQAIPPSPGPQGGSIRTRVVARVVITPQHFKEMVRMFKRIWDDSYKPTLGELDESCQQGAESLS